MPRSPRPRSVIFSLPTKRSSNPAAVLRGAREMREALVHLLDLYRAHRDAGTDEGADNPLVKERALIRRLRVQVEREADERGIDPRRAARKVAVLMESIAKRLGAPMKPSSSSWSQPAIRIPVRRVFTRCGFPACRPWRHRGGDPALSTGGSAGRSVRSGTSARSGHPAASPSGHGAIRPSIVATCRKAGKGVPGICCKRGASRC